MKLEYRVQVTDYDSILRVVVQVRQVGKLENFKQYYGYARWPNGTIGFNGIRPFDKDPGLYWYSPTVNSYGQITGGLPQDVFLIVIYYLMSYTPKHDDSQFYHHETVIYDSQRSD